ncbi:hypothetical protein PRIPAC_87224 [Pristionchus pacificus]|uniref:Uncharacterized protein n=1 Tax=Pristionchus pacificus TaxID=54126 RepID=A0A2A6B6J6_PRIPA|nr:hypothetical protein PRIPAC_87224 [Pristionchus pacificus]|eukprot:PDM61473.1 hypothetical protein PRIPAC_50915 [Pristionchus pacificus]
MTDKIFDAIPDSAFFIPLIPRKRKEYQSTPSHSQTSGADEDAERDLEQLLVHIPSQLHTNSHHMNQNGNGQIVPVPPLETIVMAFKNFNFDRE